MITLVCDVFTGLIDVFPSSQQVKGRNGPGLVIVPP